MEVRNDINAVPALNDSSVKSPPATGEIDQNVFMKLLVAQLEHQSPLSPIENFEFTAQLAQFRSLEQMEKINKTLNSLAGNQDVMNNSQAVNFIGKEIKAHGDVVLLPHEGSTFLNYNLADQSEVVTIGLTNEAGRSVRLIELTGQESGQHELQWNGLDDTGQALPAGRYHFYVNAKDENGDTLGSETLVQGIVDEVEYNEGQPLLLIQGNKIPLDSVISVTNKL